MSRLAILFGVTLFVVLEGAFATDSSSFGGVPPWRFQMTPEEVTSFTELGPYKAFRNGDLETYAAVFDGKKENVQFFFREGRLARIGIYLYEGQDAKAAAAIWGHAYQILKTNYGDMELPGIQAGSAGRELPPEAIAAAAGANVAVNVKTKMAPSRQPVDKFVFADFWRRDVLGQTFYYVAIYYDPPRAKLP